MQGKIKSVRPIEVKTGCYEFDLEVEVKGTPHTIRFTEAKQLLDFHQCRATVANHTGILVTIEEELWGKVLAKAWQKPEHMPDRTGELEEIGREHEGCDDPSLDE